MKKLSSRIIGFVGSLVLTLATFFLVSQHAVPKDIAVPVVLAFASLQAVVQFVFFLHLLSEKGPRWNLIVLASTLSILAIIVLGSLWIMQHLDYNMMPM